MLFNILRILSRLRSEARREPAAGAILAAGAWLAAG
jgi:hypothetical protein